MQQAKANKAKIVGSTECSGEVVRTKFFLWAAATNCSQLPLRRRCNM